MAYREVTMIEVKEVLRLWLAGMPKKRIAAQVGFDPKTVRRYITAAEGCGAHAAAGAGWLTDERLAEVLTVLKAPPQRERGESWARCEAERAFIEKKVARGVKLTKVHRLLRQRGVEVPYRTLHRFAVSELDFGRSAPTIPVADCEPGEELQVDTGWMGMLESDLFGHRKRFRAWVFTAVRSRLRFVYPTFGETTKDAIAACEAAWEYFGGVFRVLIPDNTKAIVVTADPTDPRINDAFLEYAQARGFSIDPTRVRSPKDKAKVERAVRHVREDCFAGERLYTMEDVRALARRWCDHEYGMRRHTRTQRMPREHFEAEEKAALLPAPETPYDVPLWCDPKVARDQHVQVAKALYSVPREHAGRRLIGRKIRARADSKTVRLYDGGQLVKVHARLPPGGRSTDPEDFPPEKAAYAMRDVDFLVRQAAKHGSSVEAYAKGILDVPQPWTAMRRVYALLGLAKRYGSERVAEACERALALEMIDVKRLKRMLEIGGPPPAQATPQSNVVPIARYLRDPKQYALPAATSRHHPNKGDDE